MYIVLAFLGGALAVAVIGSFFVRGFRARSLQRYEKQLQEAERECEERCQAAEEARAAAIRELEAKVLAQRNQLEQREAVLQEGERELRHNQQALEELRMSYRERVEEVVSLPKEQVLEEMKESIRQECKAELREYRNEVLTEGESEIHEEARRVLLDTIQRMASQPNHDMTATLVTLPNDDMKGRLIGREGRNIRAFETSTGVTLLIDETPNTVLVSSFDPVRREVARIALNSLLKDGRIHPASIEEAVHRADEEVKDSVIELGEKALRELRLGRVHPDVVILLGRMHYRLSNNQNSLSHSVEVAHLCALMASELGLDPELAKRAGLFHDIGKAASQEYEGTHAHVGAQILKRCGEDARVVNAVAAHHHEVPAESLYAALVMIGDSLSAVRPGARADSMDGYLQRVRSLEAIAREQEGVTEAYALQAGREIRVVVAPDHVDDSSARSLARSIRNRVEEELDYPGTIKVTVIREQRFSETAR